MKKQFLAFVVILILWIVWYIRYTRPLSLPIQDPGEEMFVLPNRTLPSAWLMMGQVFQSKMDTTTSETWRILIEETDKKLTSHYSTGSKVYTYGSGDKMISIDDKKMSNLFSWSELKWFINYKLQQIDDMITQYDIAVPEWSDYSVAIPAWQGVQGFIRVWSAYAYSDCISSRIEQCRQTYDILFRLSQKMKDGWILVQTLIGVVMENIVINHVSYLLQNDPIKYNPLKEMLQQEQYIWAQKIFQNAMKTEYQTYKNMIQNMDIMNNWNNVTMDMIHVIWSDGGNMWFINTVLIFILPKSLLFDQQQTDVMARYFYWKSLTWRDVFADDKDLRDYWTGPMRSRPNMIWRVILEAIIPRLTWIYTRLQDMEKLYKKIIQ